jgi:chromosome segregation ATPase
MFEWLCAWRPVPAAEPAEEGPSVAAVQQELIEAQEELAQLQGDLFRQRQDAAEARRELAIARERIGHLLVQLEERVDRAVSTPPAPRTPVFELALERARANALAERVQQLQEANMRAGCMHGVPILE